MEEEVLKKLEKKIENLQGQINSLRDRLERLEQEPKRESGDKA